MLNHPHLVIASHDIVSKHIDNFDELAWSCIIVDEVHKLKNPRSAITQAFNRFLSKARFGLTVRPVDPLKHNSQYLNA